MGIHRKTAEHIQEIKKMIGSQLHLTEHTWLRVFGTPPKFAFSDLQVRSTLGEIEDKELKSLKMNNCMEVRKYG